MTKENGLPVSLNNKLQGCINYIKTSGSPAHLLLIGCPSQYLFSITQMLSSKSNVNSKLVNDALIKQGELVAILTNLNIGDFICFPNIDRFKPEVIDIIKQSLSTSQLMITIGKGPAERTIPIDILPFNIIVTVDNISQLPSDLLDTFYEIIDFKKFEYELRIMNISNFADKYQLNFNQTTMKILATQFSNDEQLKMKLIEIRNRAYDLGVQNINEELLQDTIEAIPELQKIDTMDGREFELFVGNLFRALNYTNVTVTQSSYDFGADVIAEKDDVRFTIQCKRYSSPIGITAIQEVIASKSLHDCHVACVLTNSTFTPAAEELARKNLVVLWNGNKLKEFIERIK